MGFADHTMHVCHPSKSEAACALAEALNVGGRDYVILIYGAEATDEERAAVSSYIAEKYPRVELYEIDGGQDVYDFLMIVE